MVSWGAQREKPDQPKGRHGLFGLGLFRQIGIVVWATSFWLPPLLSHWQLLSSCPQFRGGWRQSPLIQGPQATAGLEDVGRAEKGEGEELTAICCSTHCDSGNFEGLCLCMFRTEERESRGRVFYWVCLPQRDTEFLSCSVSGQAAQLAHRLSLFVHFYSPRQYSELLFSDRYWFFFYLCCQGAVNF